MEVTATGTREGRPVSYSRTFDNDCIKNTHLGGLRLLTDNRSGLAGFAVACQAFIRDWAWCEVSPRPV